MSKFLTRLVALTVLACLVLTGCQGAGDEQPVTFMISGEPEELAAYENLVDQFSAEHPEIQVDLIYIASGGEFRERLATMFSGNRPPDTFLYNYRRLGNYAADDAIHPLGDLLDASSVLDRSDFYPVTLEAFTYEGALQCIPQNISSPVIYYNTALFDAAGLNYPQDSWTFDDFIATATALTQDTDGDGEADQWGFGTEVETIRLAPFLWGSGGDFIDDPENPTRVTLDEPAAQAAIQWFTGLRLVHGVTPDKISESAQSSEDRFLNGSVAMYMNSRVATPALRTITAFEWDAAPLPIGEELVSVLHSDGFCMSAKAASDELHAESVWTFIEYAVSETGQVLLAETGRTVPSMIRVAESSVFLESSPPANNQVWLDAADRARTWKRCCSRPPCTPWPAASTSRRCRG
jgi:multiple sugar transport system substrate-binding protein